MLVNVTQFLRPHGMRNNVQAEVPDVLKDKYDSICKHHCRLTAEVLMTGHVSLAIEHSEGDFAIEICSNGPSNFDPPAALAKLIERWDEKSFASWLEQFEEA